MNTKILQGIALVAALGMAACTDEYDYTPACQGIEATHGIYIKADTTTYIYGPDDVMRFSFKVSRHDVSSAATYKLMVSDASFGVPSTVTFAPGEKTVDVEAGFDIPVGTYGRQLVVSAAPGDAYMYGAQSQTFTFSRCKVLDGRFQSSSFSDSYGNNYYAEVSIYEYGVTDTGNDAVARYLVKNMFPMGHYDILFSVDTQGNAVCDAQPAWIYEGYGDVYVNGKGEYMPEHNAVSLVLEHYVPNVGTLTGGPFQEIIYFPVGYNPVPSANDENE